MLEAREVTVRIGPHTLIDGISLRVDAGELVAVVGPNGAGKSTLATVLAGDHRPDEGEVLLAGRPLADHSPRELARLRAVLPQDSRVAFPFRAEQVVMMGRYPRLQRYHAPGPADDAAVAAALADTDCTHLRLRPIPTLSGGEQARVSFARVLAQDTDVVILDEPSAALDLHHQQRVLGLCRTLAAAGRAVVAIVHDLNQATLAHRVALLDRGRLVAAGSPATVLTAERLTDVFGLDVTVVDHPVSGRPLILPAEDTHERTPLP
jgi:iron complex transport system ATP-binding protein